MKLEQDSEISSSHDDYSKNFKSLGVFLKYCFEYGKEENITCAEDDDVDIFWKD